ncbi:MAG TPA: type II toxin-antitoxin system ParD family antitoxin [Gemmataceae bacterium]|nr:type II toxin-antitoxin system ParD family antitoxin [Gemmataceae bacterium]
MSTQHTFQITLPDSLKEFVEGQLAAGAYSSASDYILALLHEAQKKQAWEKVESLVLDGLNSGEPVEVNPEWWEEKHRRLKDTHPEATE